MMILTNRKINSSLIHTESLEIINTIFEITLYDNTRHINAKLLFYTKLIEITLFSLKANIGVV